MIAALPNEAFPLLPSGQWPHQHLENGSTTWPTVAIRSLCSICRYGLFRLWTVDFC